MNQTLDFFGKRESGTGIAAGAGSAALSPSANTGER
jgi:hypothetical protein